MKILAKIVLLFVSAHAIAQNSEIVGYWKTIDDNTGKPESVIEIFQKQDGKYYGKVTDMLVKPVNEKCVKCTDDRKNKPLLGLEVIRGLVKDKSGAYKGGTITDPKNGNTYKCTISRKGNVLHVRGFVGFSLIGRTQMWYLAN